MAKRQQVAAESASGLPHEDRVETIREILFGESLTEIRSALADLGSRLSSEAQRLDGEVSGLADRVGDQRTELHEQVGASTDELEKLLSRLGDDLGARLDELGSRLTALQEGVRELDEKLEREVDGLRSSGATRAELADLFRTVAERLTPGSRDASPNTDR